LPSLKARRVLRSRAKPYGTETLLVNAVLAREVAALKTRVDSLDAGTRRQFEQVFEAILGLSGLPGGKQ
jgi:hypothetical protein